MKGIWSSPKGEFLPRVLLKNQRFVMLKKQSTMCFAVCLAIGWIQATVVAQPGSTPGPIVAPEGPDTGSIVGSPASSVYNVKCWISRSENGATAVSVFDDGGVLRAKFRRYEKKEEDYRTRLTKFLPPIVPPATVSPMVTPVETVLVKLVAVAGYADTYDMIYEVPMSTLSFSVGQARYVRGNRSRGSSDVVVRFRNIEGVSADPCNEPPVDDMGEEEDMPRGGSAFAPGPSVPFNAQN